MSRLVDVIARRLFEGERRQGDVRPWDGLSDVIKELYRCPARHLIPALHEALREPTPEMYATDPVIARAAAFNHGFPWQWSEGTESGGVPGKVWRTMIDEAFK
jgi:hypothetical protein